MSDDQPEPLSDQVFHEFLDLLRRRRQYANQILDAKGLKPREFSVLRMLLELGPASIGQIQTFLHNSASTTSALVGGLEDAGYVSRSRGEDDNRVVLVNLTASGQTVALQAPYVGLPLLRRRLARLPDHRLRTIRAVVAELGQLMDPEADS